MKKKSILFFVISLLAVVVVAVIVLPRIFLPKKYNGYVVSCSEKYGIERELVYAIIRVESNFDPRAKSSAGAMGLMQLIPSTAKWISEELSLNFNNVDMFDPKTNIEFGCYYLAYLFKKFTSMRAVICAYNAGETVVKGWLDESGEIDENKIAFAETKNYLNRVMGFYRLYRDDEKGE